MTAVVADSGRPAAAELQPLPDETGWRVAGDWTLAGLAPRLGELRPALGRTSAAARWDLSDLAALDSAGAMLLVGGWGGALPVALQASEDHRRLLTELAAQNLPGPRRRRHGPAVAVTFLGDRVLAGVRGVREALALFGQLLLDAAALVRAPRDFPLRELSATLYKAGLLALPVTGLVGLLIGVVLSYLSALQLRLFGAETFIVWWGWRRRANWVPCSPRSWSPAAAVRR